MSYSKNIFPPLSRPILFFILFCALTPSFVAASGSPRIDFIVFYALEADKSAIARSYSQGTESLINGYSCGQIGENRVALVQMGSGSITTAINSSTALILLKPRLVFSLGPAGSLVNSQAAGTLFRISQNTAWQKGQLTENGFTVGLNAVSDFPLDLSVPWIQKLPTAKLASGEVFVASDSGRNQIREISGATLVDMNTAGLVSACTERKMPLIVLRIVSDMADSTASLDFANFVKSYTGSAGTQISECLKTIPPDPLNFKKHSNLSRWMENTERKDNEQGVK